MTLPRKARWLDRAVITLLVLTAQLSVAGTAEVDAGQGNSMLLEYQGEMLRMNMGQGEDAYMVLRDGHVYMVTNAGGQTMVIDANQSMGMLGGMGADTSPSAAAGKVLALDATDRKETHAGIEGQVYNIRFIALDGKEQSGELVLSADARAVAFSEAMSRMATTMSKVAGKEYEGATNDMSKRLADLKMGVLRYGDDMRVKALSDENIGAERFELPAKPMDFSNMGGALGKMLGQ